MNSELAIDELTELANLQKQIADSRNKGMALQRGFWQFTAVFGCLLFSWLFIYPLTHPDMDVGKLPIIIIGVFGLLILGFLVTVDMLFFNKTYEWENELDLKQSQIAARALGLDATQVSLRYSVPKKHFVLIVSKEIKPVLQDGIQVQTPSTSLTFHINTESLADLRIILERNRQEITTL